MDPASYQKPAGQRNARSVSLRLIHTLLESQKGFNAMGGGGGSGCITLINHHHHPENLVLHQDTSWNELF